VGLAAREGLLMLAPLSRWLIAPLTAVLAALPLLAGCASTSVGSTSTSSSTSSTASAPAPTQCSRRQLRVVVVGKTAVAGYETGLIGIHNVSGSPCWLQGLPRVRFFWTSVFGARHPLRVKLELFWRRPLFPEQPARVSLVPSGSAGFVMRTVTSTSGSGASPCQPVSVMTVHLPGVPAPFELSMTTTAGGAPLDYRLCDVPSVVAVSSIVSASSLAAAAR
jgi:hypothetical protein